MILRAFRFTSAHREGLILPRISRINHLAGFGVVLLSMFLSAAEIAPASAQSSQSELAKKSSTVMRQMSGEFEDLARHVSPAVVEVLVTGYGSPADEDATASKAVGRERALGSGVIVESDGYIITNYHVVKGADRVRVVITPPATEESQVLALVKSHGRILPAKVVGYSKMIDLAVLKVEACPLCPSAATPAFKKGRLFWLSAALKDWRTP